MLKLISFSSVFLFLCLNGKPLSFLVVLVVCADLYRPIPTARLRYKMTSVSLLDVFVCTSLRTEPFAHFIAYSLRLLLQFHVRLSVVSNCQSKCLLCTAHDSNIGYVTLRSAPANAMRKFTKQLWITVSSAMQRSPICRTVLLSALEYTCSSYKCSPVCQSLCFISICLSAILVHCWKGLSDIVSINSHHV